jgi:hypothetical protein
VVVIGVSDLLEGGAGSPRSGVGGGESSIF